MTHDEFLKHYLSGGIILVDRRASGYLMKSSAISQREKSVEVLLRALMLLCTIGSIASAFLLNWYIGLAVFVFGMVAASMGQGHSAKAVFTAALADPFFFSEAFGKDAIRITSDRSERKAGRERVFQRAL